MARNRGMRFGALREAVAESWRLMEPMRAESRKLWGYYEGYAPSPLGGDGDPIPYNVFHRSAAALVANLAGGPPVVEVDSVDDPSLDGLADLTARLLTAEMTRTSFDRTAERVLLDSLFGIGTFIVGLAPSDRSALVGPSWHDPGMRFCDFVSPDDLILDATARRWEERQYHGHVYRARRRDLERSGLFDEDVIRALPRARERRAASGERGLELSDFIDLIDLWVAPGVLSDSALFLTIPGGAGMESGAPADPIRVVEWEGPDGGPYVQESFWPSRDSIIPVPPTRMWSRLCWMANAILVNIMESDSRFKRGLIVGRSMSDDEVHAMMSAGNEFVIRGDPLQVQRWEYGGASETAHRSFLQYRDLFADMSLSSALLSATQLSNEPTATEVAELSRRLDAVLGALAEKHYKCCDEVVRQWWWWFGSDPLLDETVWIDLGDGLRIDVRVKAESFRAIRDSKARFSVRRGSMRRMSSDQKLQHELQVVGAVLPLAQNIARVNPMFDGMAFTTSMLRGRFDPAEIARWWRDPSSAPDTGSIPARDKGMVPMVPSAPATPGPTGSGPMPGPELLMEQGGQ